MGKNTIIISADGNLDRILEEYVSSWNKQLVNEEGNNFGILGVKVIGVTREMALKGDISMIWDEEIVYGVFPDTEPSYSDRVGDKNLKAMITSIEHDYNQRGIPFVSYDKETSGELERGLVDLFYGSLDNIHGAIISRLKALTER